MNVEMRMAVSSTGIPVAVGGTTAAVQVSASTDNGVEMSVVPSSATVPPIAVGGIEASIQAEIGAAYFIPQGEVYDGDYNVTPSEYEQVLQTANKTMLRNVVVAPIPSNYGKITYNGSTITVS